MPLYQELTTIIQNELNLCFKDFLVSISDLQRCKDISFGHFQFNGAMKFAKKSGQKAIDIALVVATNLGKLNCFDSVKAVGPGFVNLVLSADFIGKHIKSEPSFNRINNRKFVVDFSSPNIAKQMHVGHLRSTIIGACIVKVLKYIGADVLSINHLGDWGTQFGMILAAVDIKNLSLQDLEVINFLSLYKESKVLFDTDDSFNDLSKKKVVDLQSYDPCVTKIWEIICKKSKEEYRVIYELLGVDFIYMGESFYNQFIPKMISDLELMGIITVSDGAKCIFIEDFENPLIIEKSGGGYTYATTDLAALWYRSQIQKADEIIYVTDSGQSLHFDMIFSAARKAGFISNQNLIHVGFGLVLGDDGKKFKTRSGDTEPLISLLEESIKASEKILIERGWDPSEDLFKKTAKTIGISAIKFSDLCNRRMSDYKFSYEKMLRFEGKTAPFILYSCVRAKSIIKKSTKSFDPSINVEIDDSNVHFAISLLDFSNVLDMFLNKWEPNILVEYLYDICCQFNLFINNFRVIGDEKELQRLIIVKKFLDTASTVASLVGIDLVEKM